MRPILKLIALIGVGALTVPTFGATPNVPAPGSDLDVPALGANPPRPGVVNYVEGVASIGGRQLQSRDIGRVELNPGQVLSTEHGRAEVLLTPGVFLRLDDNSSVRMILPDLTHTKLDLESGRAAVEVDELYPQNDLEIVDAGVITQLIKPGFYEFDASSPEVMVFKGKAAVEVSQGKYKVVKESRELALAQGPGLKRISAEKPAKFNEQAAEGGLYNFSSLRSQYLAEANEEIAPDYAYAPGFTPGWYWDPWMWDYTFIGMDPYWSPFGFGFFPPWYGGFYGGWGYGGWGYGGWHGHRGPIHGGAIHGGVARSGFAGNRDMGGGHFGGGMRGGGFGGGGGRR